MICKHDLPENLSFPQIHIKEFVNPFPYIDSFPVFKQSRFLRLCDKRAHNNQNLDLVLNTFVFISTFLIKKTEFGLLQASSLLTTPNFDSRVQRIPKSSKCSFKGMNNDEILRRCSENTKTKEERKTRTTKKRKYSRPMSRSILKAAPTYYTETPKYYTLKYAATTFF